eukprot:scaffold88048_cov69-Phaeocystis_antarctica.AAC.14
MNANVLPAALGARLNPTKAPPRLGPKWPSRGGRACARGESVRAQSVHETQACSLPGDFKRSSVGLSHRQTQLRKGAGGRRRAHPRGATLRAFVRVRQLLLTRGIHKLYRLLIKRGPEDTALTSRVSRARPAPGVRAFRRDPRAPPRRAPHVARALYEPVFIRLVQGSYKARTRLVYKYEPLLDTVLYTALWRGVARSTVVLSALAMALALVRTL